MKRRSFLKLLAGATCAVAVGLELALPSNTKAEIERAPKYDINPAWLNAKYEVEYLISDQTYRRLVAPSRAELADQILSISKLSSPHLPEPDYDAMDEQDYYEYLREA